MGGWRTPLDKQWEADVKAARAQGLREWHRERRTEGCNPSKWEVIMMALIKAEGEGVPSAKFREMWGFTPGGILHRLRDRVTVDTVLPNGCRQEAYYVLRKHLGKGKNDETRHEEE